MIRLSAAVAAATTAAALLAAPAFAAPSDSINGVNYACAGNEVLRVVYVNTAAGNSYAILMQQDEMIPMKLMKSASGANYKAISKDYTYQLWTKGKNADLVTVDGGKEDFVLRDCAE